MPPKGVSKAVSKRCPECKKQIPVATRHCMCGHQFFEERRRSNTALTPPLDSGPDIEEITPLRGSNTGIEVISNIPHHHHQHHQQQHHQQQHHHQGLVGSPVGVMLGGGGGKGGGGGGPPGGVGGGGGVEGGKRRSERVKREKPNFYDALEFENQARKARRERQKDDPQPQTTASGRAKRERRPKNSSPDEEDDDEPVIKEKKRRKKKKKIKKEEDEEDEDIMAGISAYRAANFGIVLADINLKLGLNNPRFT